MKPSTDELYQRLATLVGEVDEAYQGLSADDLRGKHFATDIGLDSLDIIKFVLQIEEALEVKLPDADIDEKELLKVDNLVNYIADNKAGDGE